MKRFVEGEDRRQVPLPPCLDDYVTTLRFAFVANSVWRHWGLRVWFPRRLVARLTIRPRC